MERDARNRDDRERIGFDSTGGGGATKNEVEGREAVVADLATDAVMRSIRDLDSVDEAVRRAKAVEAWNDFAESADTISKVTNVLFRPNRWRNSRPDRTSDPRGPSSLACRTRPLALRLVTSTRFTPPVSGRRWRKPEEAKRSGQRWTGLCWSGSGTLTR